MTPATSEIDSPCPKYAPVEPLLLTRPVGGVIRKLESETHAHAATAAVRKLTTEEHGNEEVNPARLVATSNDTIMLSPVAEKVALDSFGKLGGTDEFTMFKQTVDKALA